MKVCDKTCIFFFFPIINKYFLMAKRSLLSRCPSYKEWEQSCLKFSVHFPILFVFWPPSMAKKQKDSGSLRTLVSWGVWRGQASSQGLSMPIACCVQKKSCYNNGRCTLVTNYVCDTDSLQEAFVFCSKGIIKSKPLYRLKLTWITLPSPYRAINTLRIGY